jgi:hypothetical protein
MKPEEIKAEIEPIYSALFGPGGFENLSVRAGVDHADEPALFVSAKILGIVDAALEAKVALLRRRVFSVLRESGDERFPYIWTSFDDPEGEAQDDTRARKRRAS